MADMLIRQIPAEQALERTMGLWECVKHLRARDALVPQSMYIEILRYTARRILVKLEETGLDADTWKTYTDFFTQAILARGTSGVQTYLRTAERLMNAVLAFPSAPVPLLAEYIRCVLVQSTQSDKESAVQISQRPHGTPSGLKPLPDLEYDENVVACIVARPLTEVMEVLEGLPTQLTFAHRHAIVHLRLCNPFQVPRCEFVLGGYSCDTCRLRDIHTGFQAMVYDDEGAEDPLSNSNVRSNAQISGKSYGFDMCMACVVFFYAQQQECLFCLMRAPHVTYAFGHAAGVKVFSARYRSRRQVVGSDITNPDRLNVRTTSPSPPKTSGSSCAAAERKGSLGSSSDAVFDNRPSCIDAERSATATKQAVMTRRPPARPPTRKISNGVTEAPKLPATRCVAYDKFVVLLTLSLAPYGARPIAWVLNDAEKRADKPHIEEVLRQRLGPESSWRSRVTVRRGTANPSHVAATARPTVAARASSLRSPAPVTESHATEKPRRDSDLPSDRGRLSHTHSAGVALADANDDLDTCAICLCPFERESPMIEMECHHWFHVSCIEEYTLTSGDVCPLCRTANVLPDMSRATALEKNIYYVEVTLTEAERLRPYIDLCVGAIITRDGNYRNASSIAAAECVRLYPTKLNEC
ncbi:hypothetical protein JKF63_04530 [Porcisia hertigi]|uniref:RING-type domain-containing protein n=1 Tax=Porcisia hertigi TaxID=2761500 RepID=A0A836LHM3_9TRYP|nr:hypothetical protein JKF63_04530 [Porcisia hertigi]